MFPRTSATIIAGTVLSFALCSAGFGQAAGPRVTPPDARRLFEEVVKVYRAAPAYADRGVLRTEYVAVPNNGVDEVKTDSAKAQLAFARPNKIALTYGSVRILCDGNEMVTVIDGYKRYFVAKAPKEITLETFRPKRMRELLSSSYETHHPILLTLLLGQRPACDFFPQPAVMVLADRFVDGKKCLCLKLNFPDMGEIGSLFAPQEEVRLFVDPDSRRLVGTECDHAMPDSLFPALPPPPFELPPELARAGIELPLPDPVLVPDLNPKRSTWRSGAITDRVPPIFVFTFRAPPGYQHVDSFEGLFAEKSPAVGPLPKADGPDVSAKRGRPAGPAL
jgi:hypothetical protein